MSHIDLRATHTMSHDAAKSAAEELASDLARKFEIEYEWEGDHIHFERPGASGSIMVGDRDIQITARLGFMLMFLRHRIEEEIVRYLSEHFGCTFP
jgi:putative polyhydroxyalkanoate system protein